MADYYKRLGVEKDSDADTIKKAYRKLAMEYHPDRNSSPDAEENFKRVTEAYEVLRDPEQRQLYDRFGEAGIKRSAGGGPAGGFGGFDFADAFEVFMREFGGMGFGDIFGGRASRTSGPRRGGDLKLRLKVSLEEAARGVERGVKIKVLDSCSRCGGSGAEPGTAPERCGTCNGAGEVRQVQRSMLGQFVSVRPCPDCGGAGERILSPCSECSGEGRVRIDRTVQLQVPAGVSTDDYLKLSGRGNAGRGGGPRGDVLVLVEVESDPRFQRVGDDLVYNLAVTMSQAALGADIEVPTIIDGNAMLKIPQGIQSGQALRLRGRGMPRLRDSGRGDQVVRVLVWTPTSLTREERDLLEQLREVESEPPEPDTEEPGFWERVKRAFTA
ncbi:MAG: molecular chaperone DnaJ [marine benthic group bacterium]|nr:molecular chaperone DnaJ [Gemmatimonadota bacterium]